MKYTFLWIVTLVLVSCGQKKTSVEEKKSPVDTNTLVQLNSNTHEKTGEIDDWEKHQDSLRNEILKRKENKILRESFLQEMYIRDVVNISGNNLSASIPFNVHGPDCGAPDCYSTDVSFGFVLKDSLVFPAKLSFDENESGCIEKETHLSGYFDLVEQNNEYVIYHSAKHKRTLVLFSSYKDHVTCAYYFTNVNKNQVTGKSLATIFENYNEEDENVIYPFMSWILTTNEYENFLQEVN